MTVIWSWIDHLYIGPAGMLLLSDFFIFTALAILMSHCLTNWRKQLMVLFSFTFFPLNFLLIGNVTKTSIFCSTMLLAIALAFLAVSSPNAYRMRWIWGTLSVLLLFLAMSFRGEGIAAAFPILAWLSISFFQHLSFFPEKRKAWLFLSAVFTAMSLSLLFYALLLQMNLFICKNVKTHPEQVFIAGTLVALSLETNQVLVPDCMLNPQTDLNKLRAAYNPASDGHLFWGRGDVLHFTSSEQDFQTLISAFRKAVEQHPLIYLRVRARAFYSFLGPDGGFFSWPYFTEPESTQGYFPSFESVNAHFQPGRLVLGEAVLTLWMHDFFLTKPYFFALLALMNLIYVLHKGVMSPLRNQAVLLLLLSGLGHLASYFICATAADYRYSSWLIFSSSLAALLTLFGLWEEWQEKWVTA